jgi:hypothetical protein
LPDSFLIQNGLKQGNALSPLLLNFSLGYSIRKVEENQMRLKLNGMHYLQVYPDDVNLMADNINHREKQKRTEGSNVVGLEVNGGKTKYMLLSHHQNAGQIHYTKIATRSFENVVELIYFGMMATNTIHEEMKRRLNSGNACYHSVQIALSSAV